MKRDAHHILSQASRWHADGQAVAIATVLQTWGSAPRPTGSHMAICEGGDFVGSVSGGCVEAAVIDEAAGVMESGEPKELEFGVSDELAWEVGLACGGTVRVYVEALEDDDGTGEVPEAAARERRA